MPSDIADLFLSGAFYYSLVLVPAAVLVTPPLIALYHVGSYIKYVIKNGPPTDEPMWRDVIHYPECLDNILK